MADQLPPPAHTYYDEAARARIRNLEGLRVEDRAEVGAQLKTTNDLMRGMDKKLDNIQDKQAKHSTEIGILTTRVDHMASLPFQSQPPAPVTREEPVIDRRASAPVLDAWGTIPQWVRVLIWIISGVLASIGGQAALFPKAPAPATSAAPATDTTTGGQP